MSNFDFEYMGKAIKEKRKDKGYTQEKLAEKIGVEVRTIKQWEKGALSRKINFPKLLELFSALEIDSNYLLGNSYSNKEIETVCSYTGLSEKAVKELHRIKTDKDSVTPVLSNLLENHIDAFIGIMSNMSSYIHNTICHNTFINLPKKKREELELDSIIEHHIDKSSISMMNCQQWISYLGQNSYKDSYYTDTIYKYVDFLKRKPS